MSATTETLSPKETGEFVSKHSQHVKISEDGIKTLSLEILKQLENGVIKPDLIAKHETYPKDISDEKAVDWAFMLDSLNYCFWKRGKGKWEVTWRGQKYTGYFGLCAAVIRAIEEGVNMLDPKVYTKLSDEEIAHIFRGDGSVKLHLLEKRSECLKQVGNVLLEKYEGSFVNCIKKANKSAQALLKLITSEFDCFNDTATYKGKRVSFHKRAQIVIADIWTLFSGKGYGEFNDIDSITMFADYRVPQVLVHFGAMSYSDELMEVLKKDEILENGCEYEIEIRGCSIEVIERVKDSVDLLMKEKGKKYLSNSILIDNYLWMYRRDHAHKLEYIPFHKVLCVYY